MDTKHTLAEKYLIEANNKQILLEQWKKKISDLIEPSRMLPGPKWTWCHGIKCSLCDGKIDDLAPREISWYHYYKCDNPICGYGKATRDDDPM